MCNLILDFGFWIGYWHSQPPAPSPQSPPRIGNILGLLVSTCLMTQGLATAAHAANPGHLEQLRTTNSCPKCDLRDAQLTAANLQKADLSSAQLRGVQLSGAVLAGASLRQAKLGTRQQDKKTVVTNLQNADLQGAELTAADLTS